MIRRWWPWLVALSFGEALAEPWLLPGDSGLRHDIQILADAQILRGPVSTWPLSWPDLARDVIRDHSGAELRNDVHAAWIRVRREAQRAMNADTSLSWRVAAAEKPASVRAFSSTPREQGEAAAGLSWTGGRLTADLQVSLVLDPADGKRVRPDNSYVGAVLGNWMAFAGYVDRWWGPGWEGSLLLSNNARPVPALTLERRYADAFQSRWLSWIGPWRASLMFGQLEGRRTDFGEARLFGLRLTFKPLTGLEIGLSRTAQWCGKGRACDLRTFGDLLAGRDNDQSAGEQPGNQLAGYDARWSFRSVPLALYGQMIGEDEAGGLPAKFLGLLGAETWGDSRWGRWRMHAEYADTRCNFSRSQPEYDCAYENSIFTQGYRFRGRSIGHAMDADGRMLSAGVVLIDGKSHSWELLVRKVELNRDALAPEPRHTLAPLAAELLNLEISHNRQLAACKLRVGLGVDDDTRGLKNDKGYGVRGFVEWMGGF